MSRDRVHAAYVDASGTPRSLGLPSPKVVADALSVNGTKLTTAPASRLLPFWGLAITHDILRTVENASEPFSIPAPSGAGGSVPVSRSSWAIGAGGARAPVNYRSSFIDGSGIYGLSASDAAALREGVGGRLLLSSTGPVPVLTGGTFPTGAFGIGDFRNAISPPVLAIHMVLVLEHNRRAAEVGALNPGWGDEQIFQAARTWTVGVLQRVTYMEYLPALLGFALPDSTTLSYNASVDPSIEVAAGVAAMRYGHSALPSFFILLDENFELLQTDSIIALDKTYFDLSILQKHGLLPILRGLCTSVEEEVDTKIVAGLRLGAGVVFGPHFDLLAINIQRGRDVGLPAYNDVRVAYNLPRVTAFEDLTSDAGVVAALRLLYNDSIDLVDCYVGGLAEEHENGANLGPLFSAIILDQFARLRLGDRFFYEWSPALSDADRAALRIRTLSTVISDVTKASWFPPATMTPTLSTPVPQQAALNSSADSSVHTVALRKDYTLSWVLDVAAGTLAVKLEVVGMRSVRWAGLGFGVKMTDVDLYVGVSLRRRATSNLSTDFRRHCLFAHCK